MRVLYFTRGYTTHDRNFVAKITEAGHEVCYVPLEDDGDAYVRSPLPQGVQLLRWAGGGGEVRSMERLMELMPAFERVVKEVKPDLIQAGPVQTCGFMAALSGFHPLLTVSWGSDILLDADQSEQAGWVTRYALRGADMLLCDCDAVRHKVQSLVEFPDDRFVQLPWGVDLGALEPGGEAAPVRRTPGWENAFIVLGCRSWEPVYDIATTLEGFRLAALQDPSLRLVLIGDGSQRELVRQIVAQHGLGERVLLPGRLPGPELYRYIRAADVYLSTSLSDGTSISLLEAMALERPAIVSDIPGNREWIRPGEGGWLATAGRPADFAERILAAAHLGRAGRQRMGRRNRTAVEERANWHTNFGRLLKAYERLA